MKVVGGSKMTFGKRKRRRIESAPVVAAAKLSHANPNHDKNLRRSILGGAAGAGIGLAAGGGAAGCGGLFCGSLSLIVIDCVHCRLPYFQVFILARDGF